MAPAGSATIAGRWQDGLWIIFCPLLCLLGLEAAFAWSGLSDLVIYGVMLGVITVGHHMPAWLRAFGDPLIYQQHKVRLWVCFAAIPLLVIVPGMMGLGVIAGCVSVIFDLWHTAMQQHGFGRIYSAKAKDFAREGARLDLACTLTWYVTVVAWSDAWMVGIRDQLRGAGLLVFELGASAPVFRALQWTLLCASLGLLGAYLFRAWRLWRDQRVFAANKHLVHFVAFAVILYSYRSPSWYRAQVVVNVFHSIQYFFMVWIFSHLSIRKATAAPGKLFRALFEKPRGALLFAATVAAYGLGSYFLMRSQPPGIDPLRKANLFGSFALTSLLLHFYVDSFIWKVRTPDVQKTLSMEGAPVLAAGAAAVTARAGAVPAVPLAGAWRQAFHAVAYFGLPMLAVALVGTRFRPAPGPDTLAAAKQQAALFPHSADTHHRLGAAALATGDQALARSEFERALELAPSLEGPAVWLAELDFKDGDRPAELRHLTAAVAATPQDAVLRYRLGDALLVAQDPDGAEAQYRRSIELDRRRAGPYQNLGLIYKRRGDLAGSVPWFERAFHLDPKLREAALNLATTKATLGDRPGALAVVSAFLRASPSDEGARRLESALRQELPSASR